MDRCYIRPYMRRVRDEMAEVLEGQSLDDLVESFFACNPAAAKPTP